MRSCTAMLLPGLKTEPLSAMLVTTPERRLRAGRGGRREWSFKGGWMEGETPKNRDRETPKHLEVRRAVHEDGGLGEEHGSEAGCVCMRVVCVIVWCVCVLSCAFLSGPKTL